MQLESLSRSRAGRLPFSDLHTRLDVDTDSGLSRKEAAERLKIFGPNSIREKVHRGPLRILADQFKSAIIVVLVAAGIVAVAIGERLEGAAVFAVILINALIGFFTELRAVRSMRALRKMGTTRATVRREGRDQKVPATRLVPGDILILGSGDLTPADARLVEANRLQTDEAALTGESEPVPKTADSIDGEVPLAEQANMVFRGTPITSGSGRAVVTATGMETELGRIASLVREAGDETTPLEKRLDALARKLLWLTLGIATAIAAVGAAAGRELMMMAQISIALAVASVPEGLPITATIALARGMKRMADRNALVSELSTVETLGSTRILCTDKTGTLTEGRMAATSFETDAGRVEITGDALEKHGEFRRDSGPVDPRREPALAEALQAGMLCSNASVTFDEDQTGTVGEPLEVALQVAGIKAGYDRKSLLEDRPERQESAFDPELRMMATFHDAGESGDGLYLAVKGAPEAVLENCSRIRTGDGERPLEAEERERWLERNRELAREGLRLLALASGSAGSTGEYPYRNLTFLALAALRDPPRREVRGVIESCRRAGIRTVMATGDQDLTATAVAEAVGIGSQGRIRPASGADFARIEKEGGRKKLLEADLLTRVSPEQKLDLIRLHQENGEAVAMTGDGVNDAPALKKADIGVAMGAGTQVARDAADMVLLDNRLATILAAVEQGRVIFANIRCFMVYLLSSNVGTILTVGIAAILSLPMPLLPLQILFLNVVVDVFPALALGVGPGEGTELEDPPRQKDAPLLEARHWRSIAVYGGLIATSVLGAFVTAPDAGREEAATIAFLTLMLAKLWHIFNMRGRGQGLFRNNVTANPFVGGALALCLMLIAAAVYLPGLTLVLGTVPPGLSGWALALGFSLFPLLAGQLLKLLRLIE